MASNLQEVAASVAIGLSGQIGSKAINPIVANKIVTSVNMKVGTYTIAAQPISPCVLSVAVATVAGADTMGTLTFVGTDISGSVISESVIPVSGSTVYTVNEYASVTSITGAGWVVNTTADTITVGVSSAVSGNGYYFSAIQVITAAVVASETVKSGAITADLTTFASLPVGIYPTKLTQIALTSGTAIGIMSRI
jgi:hypothetical protein